MKSRTLGAEQGTTWQRAGPLLEGLDGSSDQHAGAQFQVVDGEVGVTGGPLFGRGADPADAMPPGTDGPEFLANHAGGIAGGISTGQPVTIRVAFKPTSSILTPVETITRDGRATEIMTKGRHDPCVGIRGAPVVEAMMALVLADQKLLHRAQCG